MDSQQLLATLIQLSEEQQHRIAELLNRLEQQARTLTTASQRAAQAANALDHNGQKTALHLQAAVRESVEITLHDTLTTLSQRAEGAFQDAGRPLLHTLAVVAVIIGVWLMASTLVSWRSAELEQLDAAIAQRQARLEELDRRGGKIEFEDCDGRLCVYAAKNQGKDYKNWIGPWYSKKDGSPLVIIKGY
jgi:exonuclease VII large subunit